MGGLQAFDLIVMVKFYLKQLFAALLLLLPLCANAQADVPAGATNYFYIEDGCTVQPGAAANFYVSFVGTGYYSAYNVVFGFPECATPTRSTIVKTSLSPYPYVMVEEEDEEGEIVETKEYSHSVSYNVVDNALRLGCFSTLNASFTKQSGRLCRVYFTASPYAKPGTLPITFTEQKLVKSDESAVVPANYTSNAVTVGTTSTLTLKVSATNKFGTCILPFDAEIPQGMKIYSCNEVKGENLVLVEQASFKAYTPYIIYAENGCEATLTGEVDASKYSETVTNGLLTGTVVTSTVQAGDGNYVMQNKGDGPVFYKVNDAPFVLAPGKCWLTLPASMQSAGSFGFEFGTTGIDNVAPTAQQSNVIYDISGRKVNAVTTPGIYIVNGKKVKY